MSELSNLKIPMSIITRADLIIKDGKVLKNRKRYKVGEIPKKGIIAVRDHEIIYKSGDRK